MSNAALDTTTVRRWKRYRDTLRLPLDWVLNIPANWKVRRMKEVASVRPSNVDKKSVEGETAVRLCNYVDVYKNDQITADMEFMDATATDAQIEQFSICAGDVIITKDSESWDDIAVPAYVPKTINALVCGYHLALIRPDGRYLDGAYLARCFAAEGICDQFRVAANGITRYGLDTQSIKCAVIPVPPLAEQRAIAAFLDRETARIDALIGHKERLITLLEEKRQAVISHVVTRGFDPNIPLKESGIPLIGAVPKHWAVTSFKRVTKRVVVGIAEAATHAYADEGVPIIRSTNVRPNSLLQDELLYIQPWFAAQHRSKFLYAGDLVTVRTGYPGVTAVVPASLDRSQCFTMLISTLKPDQVPDYFSYVLNSTASRAYFEVEGWGSAQLNISVPILQYLPVPVPPAAEQRKIVDSLRDRLSGLDAGIKRIRDGITRLQEYRTALISSVVTGQVDVRGEVTL